LRRWQLDHKKPLAFVLAADARLCQTDYTDDQSWQFLLGQGEDSALTLQTHYGGRAGLVSLVPIWSHDNRSIYQAQAYHAAPVVTAFAPGYLCVDAGLLPDVNVTAEYWVAESHAVTGQFSLHNQGEASVTLRFDMYGHVIIRSHEQQVSLLTLQGGGNALYLGKFANIDPVVIVENGQADLSSDYISARVGKEITVPAGEVRTVRWAHAGLPDMRNSVRLAHYWLGVNWHDLMQPVEQAAEALPYIETANPDWNATLAFAQQQVMQSFLRATDALPHPTFTTAREPINGYSRSGDGSDYIREWGGQTPMATYLLASAVATTAPPFAEGLIRNYISAQQDDGFIDWAPGAGGQRRGMLALPILAHTTWNVYEATGSQAFLREVLPPLLKFFNRWFAPDRDVDGDGVPEWREVSQTGYTGWTLFNGGVDINLTETPDLLTYLISEAVALLAMADTLSDEAARAQVEPRLKTLRGALNALWQDERFVYRDRDTHATPSGAVILEKGRADEEHVLALPIADTSRLVVEVVGGTSHKPRMSVMLQGIDKDGAKAEETLDAATFTWTYGRGTATTQTVFAQVDRVLPQGLSRVYRINIRAVDLHSTDMNTVLPLWSGVLTTAQAADVVAYAWNDLLKPNGLALFPKPDTPGADESGVWVFWNTLICEGLLRSGYYAQAVDLLKRLLRVQTATLREVGKFTLFYHEDDMHGMGERLDMTGTLPLHVLMQAFGIQIKADGSVTVSESFPWQEPVCIKQHGIVVERDTAETRVTLPDGTTTTIPAGTTQTVQPAQPARPPTTSPSLPEKPSLIQANTPSIPVHIQVKVEDEDTDTPPSSS
jgi:hypothetical protein